MALREPQSSTDGGDPVTLADTDCSQQQCWSDSVQQTQQSELCPGLFIEVQNHIEYPHCTALHCTWADNSPRD